MTFWAFAAVMGMSMSYIFIVYTGVSIVRVFLITCSTFAAMSIYGYTTKRDLTKLGSFLIMGLIGIILASIVNIFMKSSAMHFIISCVGVLVFVGLTAYDAILGSAVSNADVDFILVGDSLGTTLLGHETTIGVTMDDMVRHTSAVRRIQPKCLLVADLPFGEASLSFDRLLESSRRLMQDGGADA